MMTEGEQEKKKKKKKIIIIIWLPRHTHTHYFVEWSYLKIPQAKKRKKLLITNLKNKKKKNSIFSLDIPDGLLFISFPCVIDMSPIS